MSYFQLCVHVEVLKEKMMQSTMESALGGVADGLKGTVSGPSEVQLPAALASMDTHIHEAYSCLSCALWPRWTHTHMKHIHVCHVHVNTEAVEWEVRAVHKVAPYTVHFPPPYLYINLH